MRQRIPYVGITDFTARWQVNTAALFFEHNRSPEKIARQLHIGVMMSYKSLWGLPTKWSNVFPQKEEISAIFGHSRTFNCLHFADYDNSPGLQTSLVRARHYAGTGLTAMQLDIPWPNPDVVFGALGYSGLEVILQIGLPAFKAVRDDPVKLVERLKAYTGVIDRVLLDKSMGKGLGLDATELLPYLRAIKEADLDLGLGVAGGLGPDTVHLIQPLLEEFPDISIDAQSKLRPSGSALDPIDWSMALKYLEAALSILP